MQKFTTLTVSLALATALVSPNMALAKSADYSKSTKWTHCTDATSTCAYRNADRKMHKGMNISYTGDADIDFLYGMIPHHQGAIDMAEIELRYGKDEELRELARWIIRTQSDELAFMKSWMDGRRSNWRAEGADTLPATLEYKQAMHDMHKGTSYTGNADVDFARNMIAHHKGAIAMATTVNRYGKYQDISKLADTIFNTQSSEVSAMEEWLEENKAAAAEPVKKTKKHKKKK